MILKQGFSEMQNIADDVLDVDHDLHPLCTCTRLDGTA